MRALLQFLSPAVATGILVVFLYTVAVAATSSLTQTDYSDGPHYNGSGFSGWNAGGIATAVEMSGQLESPGWMIRGEGFTTDQYRVDDASITGVDSAKKAKWIVSVSDPEILARVYTSNHYPDVYTGYYARARFTIARGCSHADDGVLSVFADLDVEIHNEATFNQLGGGVWVDRFEATCDTAGADWTIWFYYWVSAQGEVETNRPEMVVGSTARNAGLTGTAESLEGDTTIFLDVLFQ